MTSKPSTEERESILPLRLEEATYAVGGTTLLGPLSLEIGAGSRTVIVGPNGAGKSLSLRLFHGLLTPTTGRVQWREPAAAMAKQAMVFQRPMMLRRSAHANVEYALALRKIPRARRRALATEALERVGLTRVAGSPARVLSSGEQQRLALARAWAVRPQVLFLDEPTANLDPAAAQRIETILADFHAAGTKIVMTTHDLGQCRRMADEVLFLHRGLLVERALVEQFFTAPQASESRAFQQGELVW